MATKIRLKRIGRRNRPFYRMVVMDSRKRRDGAAIEEIGWYNPIDPDQSYKIDGERALHWLGEGAIPTNAAHKLLRRAGIAHRWHLMEQGLDEATIEKEMKKWELNREDVEKVREKRIVEKAKEKKAVKAEAEVVTEAPAEETPAEEAPAEEAPAEEASEDESSDTESGKESKDAEVDESKESTDSDTATEKENSEKPDLGDEEEAPEKE